MTKLFIYAIIGDVDTYIGGIKPASFDIIWEERTHL